MSKPGNKVYSRTTETRLALLLSDSACRPSWRLRCDQRRQRLRLAMLVDCAESNPEWAPIQETIDVLVGASIPICTDYDRYDRARFPSRVFETPTNRWYFSNT